MILHPPFIISARLLAALHIGTGYVSLERAGRKGSQKFGRDVFRWWIDIPGGEFTGTDLKSGMGGSSLQDGFESLLSFMLAAGESYAYHKRTGREGDNEDLFLPPLNEWTYQFSDEISILAEEIREKKNLIEE